MSLFFFWGFVSLPSPESGGPCSKMKFVKYCFIHITSVSWTLIGIILMVFIYDVYYNTCHYKIMALIRYLF